MSKIRVNTLVKADEAKVTEIQLAVTPFTFSDTFHFLGEYEQAPGHGSFIRLRDDKLFTMYHTDMFREITEDEI
jgi:hypothetical protein